MVVCPVYIELTLRWTIPSVMSSLRNHKEIYQRATLNNGPYQPAKLVCELYSEEAVGYNWKTCPKRLAMRSPHCAGTSPGDPLPISPLSGEAHTVEVRLF